MMPNFQLQSYVPLLGTGMQLHRLIADAAIVLVLIMFLLSNGAAAQVSGVVVDANGRPLPFVTVRSGFQLDSRIRYPEPVRPGHQTTTDLDGWFTVPDTSLVYGALWFAARGYESVRRATAAGENMDVVLRRAEPGAFEPARMGLVIEPRVTLREPGGFGMPMPSHAVVGRDYEIVITAAGGQCWQLGPTLAEQVGNRVVVAVATVHSGGGACTLGYVESDAVFPVRFSEAGLAAIRVVGRWSDVSLSVVVREHPERRHK